MDIAKSDKAFSPSFKEMPGLVTKKINGFGRPGLPRLPGPSQDGDYNAKNSSLHRTTYLYDQRYCLRKNAH